MAFYLINPFYSSTPPASGVPEMPATPLAWYYMWEAEDGNAYVPDHLATPYTPLRNSFGAGEIRSDSSASNPAITRFAANGPLGTNTAATAVFGAVSHSIQLVGANTYDLENGVSYEIEVCMVTSAGTGSKNYRIGQTGTLDTHYKTVVVVDEGTVNFSTPDAACVHNFTFTNDTAKVLQILPDTSGDTATLKIGYIRLRKASDPAFVAIGSQRWGDVLSRGTKTTNGIDLNGLAFDMLGASGVSDGLQGTYNTAPLPATFTSGITRLALVRVNGGAGTGTPAVILSNDMDTGLTSSNAIATGALGVDLSTQEGYFYVQPDHNIDSHGINLIGRGYVAVWQRMADGLHEFGVDKYPLHVRTDSISFPQSWSTLRVGGVPATRLMTGSSFKNDIEVAAAVVYNRILSQDEIFEAVGKMYLDFEAEGGTLGNREVIGVIGDSNDTRGTDDWTYTLSANGYMGSEANVWLNDVAVGGRGLYTGSTFNFDMTAGGFKPQLAYLLPTLEAAVAAGEPVAVAIRGYTNDSTQVTADRQRTWDDYVSELYNPILATGAHLLLMDVLPCADRFVEADNLWIRSQMAAFAAARVGTVWHFDSGNTGLFDVSDTVNVTGPGGSTHTTWYDAPDYVHLRTATHAGDAILAGHYKTLIETWRSERVTDPVIFESDITVFFKAGQSDSLGQDSAPAPARTANDFGLRLDTIKPAVYSGSFGTTLTQAINSEYIFGTTNHQNDTFALSIMDNLDTFITDRTGENQLAHGKQVLIVDTGLSSSDVSGFSYPTDHFQKVLDWCDAAIAAADAAGKTISFGGIIWTWGAYAYSASGGVGVGQATAKASIESYCGASGSVATHVLPKFGQTGTFPVIIMGNHHHYQNNDPTIPFVSLAEQELVAGEPTRYRLIHGKGIHHLNGLDRGFAGSSTHHHPNEEELMGGVVAWYIDECITFGGNSTWPTLVPTVVKTSARKFTLTFPDFPADAYFGFKASGLTPTGAQVDHGWHVCDQSTPGTRVELVRPPYPGAVDGTLIIDTVADIPANWELRYGCTGSQYIAGNTVIKYNTPKTVPVKGVDTELFHALPALRFQGT